MKGRTLLLIAVFLGVPIVWLANQPSDADRDRLLHDIKEAAADASYRKALADGPPPKPSAAIDYQTASAKLADLQAKAEKMRVAAWKVTSAVADGSEEGKRNRNWDVRIEQTKARVGDEQKLAAKWEMEDRQRAAMDKQFEEIEANVEATIKKSRESGITDVSPPKPSSVPGLPAGVEPAAGRGLPPGVTKGE